MISEFWLIFLIIFGIGGIVSIFNKSIDGLVVSFVLNVLVGMGKFMIIVMMVN
ncbi:MAG: hypothetical protein ACFFG0_45540 [Candidatus Thorarchaeota archaeon]